MCREREGVGWISLFFLFLRLFGSPVVLAKLKTLVYSAGPFYRGMPDRALPCTFDVKRARNYARRRSRRQRHYRRSRVAFTSNGETPRRFSRKRGSTYTRRVFSYEPLLLSSISTYHGGCARHGISGKKGYIGVDIYIYVYVCAVAISRNLIKFRSHALSARDTRAIRGR